MNILVGLVPVNKPSFVIFLGVAAILAMIALWKKGLAMGAERWPTVEAKIENVFLDVETHGTKLRYQVTHAALAYSYSVAGSFYSGEIELNAGDRFVEKLDAELIGQQVLVHYNPGNPEVSMFLKNSVKGWLVIKDSRISFATWIQKLQ